MNTATSTTVREALDALELEAETPEEFLAILRAAHTASGLTPGQLSSYTDISRSTVYNWLRPGYTALPRNRVQVEAIFRYCKLTPDQLLRVLALWERLDEARAKPTPPAPKKVKPQVAQGCNGMGSVPADSASPSPSPVQELPSAVQALPGSAESLPGRMPTPSARGRGPTDSAATWASPVSELPGSTPGAVSSDPAQLGRGQEPASPFATSGNPVLVSPNPAEAPDDAAPVSARLTAVPPKGSQLPPNSAHVPPLGALAWPSGAEVLPDHVSVQMNAAQAPVPTRLAPASKSPDRGQGATGAVVVSATSAQVSPTAAQVSASLDPVLSNAVQTQTSRLAVPSNAVRVSPSSAQLSPIDALALASSVSTTVPVRVSPGSWPPAQGLGAAASVQVPSGAVHGSADSDTAPEISVSSAGPAQVSPGLRPVVQGPAAVSVQVAGDAVHRSTGSVPAPASFVQVGPSPVGALASPVPRGSASASMRSVQVPGEPAPSATRPTWTGSASTVKQPALDHADESAADRNAASGVEEGPGAEVVSVREGSRCARRSWQVSSILTLIGSAALIIVLLHALAGTDRTLAGPVTVAYLAALVCALVMVGLGAVERNRRTAYHRLANAPAVVAMAGVAVATIATVVPHAGDPVAAGTVAGTAGLVWAGWWFASLSMRGVRLLLTDVPMECTVAVLIGTAAGGWVGISGYPASSAVLAGALTTAALVHLFGNAAAALVDPPHRDETGAPTTPPESATRGGGTSLTARDLIDISTPPLPRLPRRRPQARNMHELLVGITSAPKPVPVQADSVLFGPEPARRPVPAYEIIDRINNERRQAAEIGGEQPFAARPRSLGRRTGARFGRYRLRSLVGKGGMGEVYEAFDTIQGRRVAVKLLSEAVALDPAYQANFRRQTALAAQLAAPYIVPIHDWGVINGVLFAATRLIDGTDLHTVLRRGPVTAEQAVSVIEQIAAALDAAHAVGLVHADVKPANILLTTGGAAYLSDFGIAHPAADSGPGANVEACAYRAPERFTTTSVTAGCDIYALTGVLFEALTGLPPFPAATTGEVIHRQLTDPPPRPSTLRPTVPPAMDAVIRQGMAKLAAERFPTATALARAARAALGAKPRPQTTPPPQPALLPQPAPMPRSAPPRSVLSVGPGASLRSTPSVVSGASPRSTPSVVSGASPRSTPSVVSGASPRSTPSVVSGAPLPSAPSVGSGVLPGSAPRMGSGVPTRSAPPAGPELPMRSVTRTQSAFPPEITPATNVVLPPQPGVPTQLVSRVRSVQQAGTGWPTRSGSPKGPALPPATTPAMKLMLPPQPPPSTWSAFAAPAFSAPPAPWTQRALPTRIALATRPTPLPAPAPLPQRALPPQRPPWTQPTPRSRSARRANVMLPPQPASSAWACICDGA
ncbi:hypothetical protein AW168_11765 [Nocardia brasiliensis]|uniref:non-specific serine/threonine protein kinase n=1 Tax=Nocardia brasiliensis (strain ATCC 700358 / HUJEG-1) TaxID=1133849 RepID=K0EVV7_NOCB7|nr:serine/threonine protein kinase [Nocardia brasiliensis ATCC 700358]OCF90617.1 hypothetical protein AW168_11765 [Nocardia brasiliensis]